MSKPLSEVVCCVVDHGLFPHIAMCMAEHAKQVFYTGTPEHVLRKFEDDVIGDGFDNITRVESLWQVDERCDLFVFPDTGFHWEQMKLLREGKPVFGHHGADVLEAIKGKFLKSLEDCSFEVPPHYTVTGMDELMESLKDEEDKFVKVAKGWRGDWETYHWRNADRDMNELRGHKYNRSPFRNKIKFYVFHKLDAVVEDGIDTNCIDGESPKTVLHAMEKKDKSLIGAMQPMSEISKDVREVTKVYGELLGLKYGYRGPFSTEIRLGDKRHFIDPTLRFGSPPSQLQTVLIKNLAEQIYFGALGEVVEPEYDDPIGAQVLITTDKEKEEYLTFPMDDELKPFVKSAFCCQCDDVLQVAPNPLENWAGWLVATGKTISGVLDRLKELKGMLPEGFDCDITGMSDLINQLDDAKEQGIQITKQKIPDVAEVLE